MHGLIFETSIFHWQDQPGNSPNRLNHCQLRELLRELVNLACNAWPLLISSRQQLKSFHMRVTQPTWAFGSAAICTQNNLNYHPQKHRALLISSRQQSKSFCTRVTQPTWAFGSAAICTQINLNYHPQKHRAQSSTANRLPSTVQLSSRRQLSAAWCAHAQPLLPPKNVQQSHITHWEQTAAFTPLSTEAQSNEKRYHTSADYVPGSSKAE
jgi:hypothetical protein